MLSLMNVSCENVGDVLQRSILLTRLALKPIGDFNNEDSIFSFPHLSAVGVISDGRFGSIGAKLL